MTETRALSAPLIIGDKGGLHCVLDWRDDYGTRGPVGLTWGDLQLWVEDTLVWGRPYGEDGQPRGLRWSWIELLEFLAIAWPYLEEEETWPIDFDTTLGAPRHLGELRGKSKLRWQSLPQEADADEQERLEDFLLVHDLGKALKGAFPPSVILLRQGCQMRVATRQTEWRLDYQQTMANLEALAEGIGKRLIGLDDARSELALGRWRARAVAPGEGREGLRR